MFKLEAKLAGMSIAPLLISIALLIVVSLTIWGTCIVLLGYLFVWIFASLWIALASVLAFNILMFVGLLGYFRFNLRQMTFEKTRRYFSRNQETNNGEIQSANTN